MATMGAKANKRTQATVEITNAMNADRQQKKAKLFQSSGCHPHPNEQLPSSSKALWDKERLDNWRDGDGARILLNMLVKSIIIYNKYSLYNRDDGWKAVVQAVSRTLTGKREKEHDKLIKDTNNWMLGLGTRRNGQT